MRNIISALRILYPLGPVFATAIRRPNPETRAPAITRGALPRLIGKMKHIPENEDHTLDRAGDCNIHEIEK